MGDVAILGRGLTRWSAEAPLPNSVQSRFQLKDQFGALPGLLEGWGLTLALTVAAVAALFALRYSLLAVIFLASIFLVALMWGSVWWWWRRIVPTRGFSSPYGDWGEVWWYLPPKDTDHILAIIPRPYPGVPMQNKELVGGKDRGPWEDRLRLEEEIEAEYIRGAWRINPSNLTKQLDWYDQDVEDFDYWVVPIHKESAGVRRPFYVEGFRPLVEALEDTTLATLRQGPRSDTILDDVSNFVDHYAEMPEIVNSGEDGREMAEAGEGEHWRGSQHQDRQAQELEGLSDIRGGWWERGEGWGGWSQGPVPTRTLGRSGLGCSGLTYSRGRRGGRG
jgi:hypothetical protein